MTDRNRPRLRVKESVCNACMSCQAYCATAREGFSAVSSSRVHITLDPWGAKHRIAICRQCGEAACAQACPEKAIQRSEDGAYWAIDYRRCTGCRECVAACRLGGIWYDPLTRQVIKCDTCQGEPVCARICPMGALSRREGSP
jgi:Fe-S-cluster-containing hydrogenase component 2